MHDDCAVVPVPSVARSRSATRRAPSMARWQAIEVPITPPPTTMVSNVSTG